MKGVAPYWISTPNSIHLKARIFNMLQYKMTTFFWIWSEQFINCIKGAEVSRMELKPFPRTISRWDGRCMSAPPVGLWAPPVPFGNQWPPCTGWCPGSSLIRWWGRGGWGFAFLSESGGCWFSVRPAGHAASTDGYRNASPWSEQTPQSEVCREGLERSKCINNNASSSSDMILEE